MTPYFQDDAVTLHHGDALEVLRQLPDQSVDCVVTSPPYFGLRDYGVEGQIGDESSPAEFVAALVEVFAETRRVLADDGTLWLNLGDSYSGSWGNQGRKNERGTQRPVNKPMMQPVHDGRYGDPARRNTGAVKPGAPPAKNLMGMPWRVAFALQDDGWILRNDVIWSKPNAMPESVTDRLSSRHEHLFLFAKSRRYWFDLDPIREPLAHPDRITGHMFGGANKAPRLVTGSASTRTGSTYDKAPERGRNPGDVWTIPTQPFPGAHFATMPPALAERAIQAGCKPGGTVLDPFSGSGTTGLAAARHGRRYVGIDLNAEYLDLSLRTRLAQCALLDGAS
ncbi:site-specific DNA-methyltransferase [uncultured Aeromicrobium sp.]|uniref:DNA-methyltransferase n=1 Tax=uncultured Aeromicrobium sp. TaxID=337820 RepID=UPI0025FF9E50|nr:site-specific DNA-methyltransferase [uncultured Aeromicrobium sp.]